MKVFIAAPFTNKIDKVKKIVDGDLKETLLIIDNLLKCKGYKTFLAHRREDWGLKLMSPDECTYKDYKEMESSDIVVVIPGNPPSGGAHIEIGWASAMKKKILILIEKGKKYSPLVLGLEKISDVEFIEYENINDIIKSLKNKF